MCYNVKTMGGFNRDDRSGGGFRGGFRGNDRGGRGGFGGNRSSFGGGRSNDRGDRPMFTAICSNCGKECQVPFRPTNGKPVYCSDCFEKMGNGRDSGRPERSDFRPQAPVQNQNNTQLDALNAKLDKIISLLEVKSTVVTEEVKAPKVKKTKIVK